MKNKKQGKEHGDKTRERQRQGRKGKGREGGAGR